MKTKKKAIMLIIIFMLTISVFAQFTTFSYAFSLQDMKSKADNFKQAGQGEADKILPIEGSGGIEEKFIPIGQVLVTIASIVLVIVTLIMAIKYLTANAEQKGKLKQQLIGLVVSIVVIYGAVGIWSLIKQLMEDSGL